MSGTKIIIRQINGSLTEATKIIVKPIVRRTTITVKPIEVNNRVGEAVDWDDIENKPTAFPPVDHGHPWTEITGKPEEFTPSDHYHDWNEIQNKPTEFNPSSHSHDWNEIGGKPTSFNPETHGHTWNEITDKPTSFNPDAHGHNWNEITGKPTEFNPSEHGHAWAEITGKPSQFDPTAHGHTWTEISEKPLTFAPSSHGHTWEEISGKPSEFDPTAHGHEWSEISGKPTEFNPVSHSHPWSEISEKPTEFTPSSHSHAIGDVTGLTEELASKAGNPTRKQALVIETDFYNNTSPYAQGLIGVAISSGTTAERTGTPDNVGVMSLRDSTTANGGFRISTSLTALRLGGSERQVTIFRMLSAKTTYQVRIGFHDSSSVTEPVDAVCLQYTSSTGLIQGKTRNNNVQSLSVTTFAPVLNTWYVADITLNANATSANFKIFNLAGTLLWEENIATNIPTASGRELGAGVLMTESSTDAGADIIDLDYLRIEINRVLVR